MIRQSRTFLIQARAAERLLRAVDTKIANGMDALEAFEQVCKEQMLRENDDDQTTNDRRT